MKIPVHTLAIQIFVQQVRFTMLPDNKRVRTCSVKIPKIRQTVSQCFVLLLTSAFASTYTPNRYKTIKM